MPSKHTQKSQKSIEREGRLQLAISALKNNQISNIYKAAWVFEVPHITLQNQIHGSQHRIEQRANSHKLTQFEEESLIQ